MSDACVYVRLGAVGQECCRAAYRSWPHDTEERGERVVWGVRGSAADNHKPHLQRRPLRQRIRRRRRPRLQTLRRGICTCCWTLTDCIGSSSARDGHGHMRLGVLGPGCCWSWTQELKLIPGKCEPSKQEHVYAGGERKRSKETKPHLQPRRQRTRHLLRQRPQPQHLLTGPLARHGTTSLYGGCLSFSLPPRARSDILARILFLFLI